MSWHQFLAGLMVVVLLGAFPLATSASDPASGSVSAGGGATAAAVASDIVYVPGKAIVCGTSGVLWLVSMLLTFGALYRESADFVKGGCGGKWVLTGEDFTPASAN